MRHVAAIAAYALCDLTRKLACRRKGQDARAAFGRVLVLIKNMRQGWQGEASCFAGARLRNAHDVAAREGRRDGLGLDGRWRAVAEVFERAR